LRNLSTQLRDQVQDRKPTDGIILGLESSVCETDGREGEAKNPVSRQKTMDGSGSGQLCYTRWLRTVVGRKPIGKTLLKGKL